MTPTPPPAFPWWGVEIWAPHDPSWTFNSPVPAPTSIFMAGMGMGQEGHHWGGGSPSAHPALGRSWGCWGMGIKSRRENILQQVQLATGLNGCQPARKSQTHLCSSVGHQMGPGLVFWAGVIWGGWARLEGGLAAPGRDAHTPPAFPHIYPGIFSLFYQLEVRLLLG